MKIITKNISVWDEKLQRYVTEYEEAFDYDGPVAQCLDGGGGGGSSAPTQTTVTNVNIPEYARPYYETLMGQAQAVTDINQNPWQPYTGEQTAGFSPMQTSAFNQLQNMQLPGQTADASNMAWNTYNQAGQYQNYNPTQFQNQYYSPQFQGMGLGMQSVTAPSLQNFYGQAALGSYDPNLQNINMQAATNDLMTNPGARVGTDQWIDPGMAQAYMSPYIQGALDPTMQAMQRASDLRQQQMSGQAQQAGAYGGYRHALQLAEEQSNTQKNMGDVYAQGMQNAFNQANQAYGTDRARMLQAALANQGVGVQGALANQQALQAANAANQQAGLGVQALNAGLGSQWGLANLGNLQQMGLANQQAGLGVQQLGAGNTMQAQLANQGAYQNMQQLGLQQLQNQNAFNQANAANYAQYGLAAQQAAEASRQFGANLGLSGLQQQMAAAGLLGNLGQQQYGQMLGLNQAQQMAGAQQQNYAQQLLNNQYQNWLGYQNWPYRNIGFMADVLGRPMQQSSTSLYQAPPTAQQSLLGLGLGAYGLSGLLGGTPRKAGGLIGYKKGGVVGLKRGGKVKHYVLGGGVMGQAQDKQLQKLAGMKPPTIQSLAAAQELQNRGVLRTAQPVPPEVTLPPMAQAYPQLPEQQAGLPQLPAPNMSGVVTAAKGGIIGFAGGGLGEGPMFMPPEADEMFPRRRTPWTDDINDMNRRTAAARQAQAEARIAQAAAQAPTGGAAPAAAEVAGTPLRPVATPSSGYAARAAGMGATLARLPWQAAFTGPGVGAVTGAGLLGYQIGSGINSLTGASDYLADSLMEGKDQEVADMLAGRGKYAVDTRFNPEEQSTGPTAIGVKGAMTQEETDEESRRKAGLAAVYARMPFPKGKRAAEKRKQDAEAAAQYAAGKSILDDFQMPKARSADDMYAEMKSLRQKASADNPATKGLATLRKQADLYKEQDPFVDAVMAADAVAGPDARRMTGVQALTAAVTAGGKSQIQRTKEDEARQQKLLSIEAALHEGDTKTAAHIQDQVLKDDAKRLEAMYHVYNTKAVSRQHDLDRASRERIAQARLAQDKAATNALKANTALTQMERDIEAKAQSAAKAAMGNKSIEDLTGDERGKYNFYLRQYRDEIRAAYMASPQVKQLLVLAGIPSQLSEGYLNSGVPQALANRVRSRPDME